MEWPWAANPMLRHKHRPWGGTASLFSFVQTCTNVARSLAARLGRRLQIISSGKQSSKDSRFGRPSRSSRSTGKQRCFPDLRKCSCGLQAGPNDIDAAILDFDTRHPAH